MRTPTANRGGHRVLWRCQLTLFALGLLVPSTNSSWAEPPQQSSEAALSPEFKEILSWLPVDTESLMVASGRFEYQPPDPRQRYFHPPGVRSNSNFDFLQVAIANSGLLLFDELGAPFLERFVQQPLRHTLLATRKFGQVTGIPGGAPFDGCAILWFDRGIPKDTITADAKEGLRTERIEGQVVASLATREEWGENKKLTLYYAHPKPHVLLAATDREFLSTMLARMTRRSSSRAFPVSLAAWQDVNTSSPIWGIRYELDPPDERTSQASSPVSSGLTYYLANQPRRELVVRFRSTKREPDVAMNAFFESIGVDEEDKTYRASAIGNHVAEARLTTDQKHYSLAVVSLLMGYVVYP